jgi:anti-sigma B factor antagonist
MRPYESPSVSVARRGPRCLGSDPLRTVVWVRGEHDMATRAHLFVTIAQAARLADADIVVDLSGVTFMDASTVDAFVLARNRLRARSRSLSVRAPSPPARRLLELCGLARLIDEHPAPAQPLVATALGSWVDVPARDSGTDSAQLPVDRETPSRELARVTARRRVEPAGSVQQKRAPL